MDLPQPFFREQGTGPGVVCLHSNASSSSQWRALGDLLQDRYRVIAGAVQRGPQQADLVFQPQRLV